MDLTRKDCVDKGAASAVVRDAEPVPAKHPQQARGLRTFAMALGVWLSIGLVGCAGIGPTALSRGRPAYNAVLAETNAEQTLAFVVSLRYGETSSLLSVTSINATVRFGSNAAVEVGAGPESNYAGNLVPLSGGVAYEESPTITYVPVQGPEHLRSLLSPVPSNLLIPLLNNTPGMGSALTLLVERINGVSNPAFRHDHNPDPDRRFEKIAAHFHTLNNAGVLKFIQAAEREHQYYLWLRDYAPAYVNDISELLALLQIDGVVLDGSDILLPIKRDIHRPGEQSIDVHSYSVFEIAKMLALAIDLPPEDLDLGMAVPTRSAGREGMALAIRRAKERPATAAVATSHRGWWFYIDGSDQQSKLAFRLLDALIAVRIADATKGTSVAPVLTVPVGGQGR
jgi:hypothetical protein